MTRVRLKGGEEGLESSQQQKHHQPDAADQRLPKLTHIIVKYKVIDTPRYDLYLYISL